MLKQKYFLTGIFILSAERQPIKLAWRKIVWLHTDKKIINPCHPRYPRLKNNRLAGPFTSDMPSFFLYIYLTIEVSGCRLPVTLFRNAFAEPKFRNKSRRTGRWFKSSVTKKVITSFSFPFLSYSTNEKIRQR